MRTFILIDFSWLYNKYYYADIDRNGNVQNPKILHSKSNINRFVNKLKAGKMRPPVEPMGASINPLVYVLIQIQVPLLN